MTVSGVELYITEHILHRIAVFLRIARVGTREAVDYSSCFSEFYEQFGFDAREDVHQSQRIDRHLRGEHALDRAVEAAARFSGSAMAHDDDARRLGFGNL